MQIKTIISTLIVTFLFVLMGGVIFIYSGIFDVSARWNDPAMVKWVLVTTREHSIDARKGKIKVPSNLDDPKIIQEGFELYRTKCVICHRAPGMTDSDIGRGLNPPPPNFAQLQTSDVDFAEYFLTIKNGIRMTAMPAWGVTLSDDKIWAMIGFLNKLPGMTPAQYKAF